MGDGEEPQSAWREEGSGRLHALVLEKVMATADMEDRPRGFTCCVGATFSSLARRRLLQRRRRPQREYVCRWCVSKFGRCCGEDARAIR